VDTRRYIENRSGFPEPELAKYRGTWVAFSCDGRRILASALDVDRVEDSLAALGQDPEQVVLESIDKVDKEISLGGGELS
jgi:hypothetical protein